MLNRFADKSNTKAAMKSSDSDSDESEEIVKMKYIHEYLQMERYLQDSYDLDRLNDIHYCILGIVLTLFMYILWSSYLIDAENCTVKGIVEYVERSALNVASLICGHLWMSMSILSILGIIIKRIYNHKVEDRFAKKHLYIKLRMLAVMNKIEEINKQQQETSNTITKEQFPKRWCLLSPLRFRKMIARFGDEEAWHEIPKTKQDQLFNWEEADQAQRAEKAKEMRQRAITAYYKIWTDNKRANKYKKIFY